MTDLTDEDLDKLATRVAEKIRDQEPAPVAGARGKAEAAKRFGNRR